MQIGQVAEASGLTVQTIRYYEQRGLIPEPPRTDGGFRKFPPQTIKRLQFIKRVKELGFTLREVSELLSLRAGGSSRCEGVRAETIKKLQEVRKKISDLRDIEVALQNLAEKCEAQASSDDCPILDELEPSNESV